MDTSKGFLGGCVDLDPTADIVDAVAALSLCISTVLYG